MKVCISMEKNMGKATLYGRIRVFSLGSFMIIIYMVMVRYENIEDIDTRCLSMG